ncbi:hypothetical protein ACFOY8_14680 [Thalassospira xianhensis]|uniref:Uncharacterized protein n=1 Tax=Thalassospira xianhensis MCCC 1A02616 TaxID=1177929 RepID=A0A367UH20_9PROT|nr:hypothetical protein [Thalassospira xianhensis]RCK07605.1 hypothetical protein TH5_00555 [Thalassospira xianhensis MCCC 1A02616]
MPLLSVEILFLGLFHAAVIFFHLAHDKRLWSNLILVTFFSVDGRILIGAIEALTQWSAGGDDVSLRTFWGLIVILTMGHLLGLSIIDWMKEKSPFQKTFFDGEVRIAWDLRKHQGDRHDAE